MLSTHHMDEADILGDRIAIVSHGKVKAVGSALFMKSTFGDGYHLIIAKKMLNTSNNTTNTTNTTNSASNSIKPHGWLIIGILCSCTI